MINFEAIAEKIVEAAGEGLGAGAQVVAARARKLAPVRRIFRGGYHIRFKTPQEIDEAAIPRDLAFKFRGPPTVVEPEYGNARTITGRRPPVHWRERRLSAADRLLAQYDQEMARRRAGLQPRATFLTRRGAYEVRSRRALFTTFEHAAIGGRLRGEIFATGVSRGGSRAEAWVISPTPYAKFQEFGTRHNAAHPFLRPAAAESQSDVVGLIRAAVGEASRTGATKTEIEIVVRL